jgi:hypothetical protein
MMIGIGMAGHIENIAKYVDSVNNFIYVDSVNTRWLHWGRPTEGTAP